MGSSPHERFEEWMAAYAVGALAPGERAALEAHAGGCPECGPLYVDLARVAQMLPYGVDLVDPPARLRDRVLRSARGETPTQKRQSIALETPRRGWTAFAVPALAFATAIACGAAAVLTLRLDRTRRRARALETEVAARGELLDFATAPGVRSFELTATAAAPNARARLLYDPRRGGAVLVATGLRPLPASRAYELWFIGAGGPSGRGLMRVDPAGRGQLSLLIRGPLAEWQAAGMTEEPAGGSPAPTGELLLAGSLQR